MLQYLAMTARLFAVGRPALQRILPSLLALVVACVGLVIAAPAWAGPKTGKPWLGVSMKSGLATAAHERGLGVIVDIVFPKSPAAKAKLQTDDMLVSADGVPLDEPRDLVQLVSTRRPGGSLRLEVRRGGREHAVNVELTSHPGPEGLMRLIHVGRRADDLLGATAVQGQVPARMKDLEGKVVVLDFFAAWCGVCRALTPSLAGLHRSRGPRGLQIIGLTSAEPDVAKKPAKAWNIPSAVASDTGGMQARSYMVSAIPAMFLVNKKGIIVDVAIGFDSEGFAKLEKHIDALLAEK